MVVILFAVAGASLAIAGCKASPKENDVAVISNEKFKTSNEFIENEDLLYGKRLNSG